MRTRSLQRLVLGLLLASTCVFAQDGMDDEDYGPQPKRAAEAKKRYEANLKEYKGNTNVLVLPGLVADREERRVDLLTECTGLVAEEPIEFLLIDTTSSHGYEAMLWSHAKPSDVHKALEFIGLQPGAPFDPRMLRFWADGDRVKVEVTADSDQMAFPIEQMILDTETETTLPEEGFVFSGSMMVQPRGSDEKKYAADEWDPKSVASIYNEPSAVLDVPRQVTQADGYERQVVNPECAFRHGDLLTVIMTPADPDGKPRARHFTIDVGFNAKVTNTVCRLVEKEGEQVGDPGTMSDVIKALVEIGKKERVPFIAPSFAADLPIRETARVCAALGVVEAMGVARIDPPGEGQFYYRAFIPDQEWRKPEGRPTQPWELHLKHSKGKIVGEMVWYEPVWADGSLDPTYTRWERPAETPEVMLKVLKKDAARREEESLSPLPRVLLVFAGPDMTYGQVTEFLAPAQKSHGTVYVFMEGKKEE